VVFLYFGFPRKTLTISHLFIVYLLCNYWMIILHWYNTCILWWKKIKFLYYWFTPPLSNPTPGDLQHLPINKCINHAPTSTSTYNQPVPSTSASTMHQPVPSKCTSTMHKICTNHASTTHQLWIINMYQHHQLYTSCMCQIINYLSQPCTQHVPQPKSLNNFIYQIWFVTL